MGRFVKGDIVVIPFPFSDSSAMKRRPALVIATLTGDDVILCQITSKTITDSYAIAVSDGDFTDGGLHQESNIRPNRIFTADSSIILYRAGVLSSQKVQQVVAKIIQIYQCLIKAKSPPNTPLHPTPFSAWPSARPLETLGVLVA